MDTPHAYAIRATPPRRVSRLWALLVMPPAVVLLAAIVSVSSSPSQLADLAPWVAATITAYVVAYLLAVGHGPVARTCVILFSPLAFLIGGVYLSRLGALGYDPSCEGDPCFSNLGLIVIVIFSWIAWELGAIVGSIQAAFRDRDS